MFTVGCMIYCRWNCIYNYGMKKIEIENEKGLGAMFKDLQWVPEKLKDCATA